MEYTNNLREIQHPTTEEDYIESSVKIKKGAIITTKDKNIAHGNSVAIGSGIIANDRQIVFGSYNDPNTTDILQIGGGTSSSRKTIFSISKDGVVNSMGVGVEKIIVEETDGLVHEVVFTNGDNIEKLYTEGNNDTTLRSKKSSNNTY